MEVFTNLMQEYSVNHITSLPHYPQSNGLAEKFVQIVKNLFYKAKEGGTDLHKSLMIYHNTPLSSNLQSLQVCRSARSQLPLSNTARRQIGLSPQQIRTKTKNVKMVSSDYYIPMQGTKKLQDCNKRWCHIQKNSSPSEAIYATKKAT